MKKVLFISIFLITALISTFGQTDNQIIMKKVFGGYKFYQNDNVINMKQLSEILEVNELAYDKFKQAKKNSNIATIMSATGGALIGYQLAMLIVSGELNGIITGIGGGLMIASIPINKKSQKQFATAINNYNTGLKINSSRKKPNIEFVLGGNNIGLRVKF